MKRLLILVFIILFSGCATYKKKQKNFQEFAYKYPEELAKLSNKIFPIPTGLKKGEPKAVAPVILRVRDTIVVNGKDSIIERYVDCPPSTEQTDTLYQEDLRKLFLKDQEIEKLKKEIDQKNRRIDSLYGIISKKEETISSQKDHLASRMYVIIGLAVVMGLSIFLKLKKII